jgi:hypothetical protein
VNPSSEKSTYRTYNWEACMKVDIKGKEWELDETLSGYDNMASLYEFAL